MPLLQKVFAYWSLDNSLILALLLLVGPLGHEGEGRLPLLNLVGLHDLQGRAGVRRTGQQARQGLADIGVASIATPSLSGKVSSGRSGLRRLKVLGGG